MTAEPETDPNSALILWSKIGFIIFCFCQAFFAGIIPTVVTSCRESPKVLGFAQAFASGIFLSICLVHILPEQSNIWTRRQQEKNGLDAKIFPLAELVTWFGYIIILVLDKVLFDTHALFDRHADQTQMTKADSKTETDINRSINNEDNLLNSEQERKESTNGVKSHTKDFMSLNEAAGD